MEPVGGKVDEGEVRVRGEEWTGPAETVLRDRKPIPHLIQFLSHPGVLKVRRCRCSTEGVDSVPRQISWAVIVSAVGSASDSAVGSALDSAVGSAVDSAVGSAVDSALDSAVGSALDSAVDSAVGSADSRGWV